MKSPSLRSGILAAVVGTLAVLAPVVPADAVPTDYLFSWGTNGTGNGQFNSPTDISIGPGGDVYVLDYGNQRIQKFDPDGNFLLQWGTARSFQGTLQSMGASPDGFVYVQATYYVQMFDANGAYQVWWGPTGGASSGGHHLTVDALGRVCITYGLHGASSTDRYLPYGTFAGQAFGAGYQYGGTVFDSDGEAFYVGPDLANPGQSKIYKRSSAGPEIGSWPATAGKLAVDLAGNVYAPAAQGNFVRIYDNNGAFLTEFGAPGSGPGQFSVPTHVAVSPTGRIYVVDSGNHRIQVFGEGAVPATPVTWGRIKGQYR